MTDMRKAFDNAQSAREFMFGGNATITIVSRKTQRRFTFKVSQPRKARGSDDCPHFVALMNGPDNESNYQYLGVIRGNTYSHGRKSRISAEADSARAFAWAFSHVVGRGEIPDTLEVWHEGKCARCGRKLTVPESLARGFGPECAGRV